MWWRDPAELDDVRLRAEELGRLLRRAERAWIRCLARGLRARPATRFVDFPMTMARLTWVDPDDGPLQADVLRQPRTAVPFPRRSANLADPGP